MNVNLQAAPKGKNINPNRSTFSASPFIKWVGGKRSLLTTLLQHMPEHFQSYYEPFLGGGALFYALRALGQLEGKCVYLSDINADLVITYQVVKTDIHGLIASLKEHANNHNDDYYYQVRDRQQLSDHIERAARFIYLNKTCFNGLWRVNRKNEFNVPMGRYKKPGIVQETNLHACCAALQGVEIEYQCFDTIRPQKNDFVYFDPPYHPTDETSFTKYSKHDFTAEDQIKLSQFALSLHQKGVKVMLSNSDTPFIRALYEDQGFQVLTVQAPRMVSCKPNERHAVNEVLITNYKLGQ